MLINKNAKELLENKKIAAEISKVAVGKDYAVPTVRFVEEDKIEEFLF